ncbi:CoA-substrate-specific enzyme activase, putative [Peptostreptococcus russellii]|uniref:CoA-substrate-specific enzyme activase, putative n=1 Tax=Peptostreptococcus russellii TaxID=215200 RepID=A0A1H8EQW3_9FIRM|nr:2-hydroxyacyl-CoA dehydratase [Peptostreptococcus russellii]SEN21766.1 CoA-substrate-specific enzyme activase, putative [Peptostreptococcus russellii]
MEGIYNLGIDVGSTTVKAVVLSEDDNILYKEYRRHFSDVKKAVSDQLKDIFKKLGNINVRTVITGSGGIGLSKKVGIKFEQEVISSTESINHFHPETDAVIELGGEDAKVTFLSGGIDQRMNGICAGGTGAFIDQMASLLKTDAAGLNELAKNFKVIYPIASRCGVFAKTDIQPLINDGASKADIAMSIFNAVVVQTVSVLSCGRKIEGKVAFLGGPLYFLSELRKQFATVLKLESEDIIFPENAQLYVAMGAALLASNENSHNLQELIDRVVSIETLEDGNNEEIIPLFKDEKEYEEFSQRHAKAKVKTKDIYTYSGNCFLGIDAGSTTTKAALINDEGELLYTHYGSNEGSPLKMSIKILKDIYSILPDNCKIARATVTGYGEELIKKALRMDEGEIETIAHYKAAKFFNPDVDFILDIGGQDMKCLKIKNGVIDQIILNEACSSGCGSFLESFAKSLHMDVIDFSKEGVYAKNPVDLGSRCTVFMNSRVKQAQKEGATVSDISSGLAYSVVKNALFKVIKLRDVEELGENVVVQGGTFYNDLVLRSFEILTEREVTRPNIAGLMGAFGCALISKENYNENKSSILNEEELSDISVESSVTRCKGCSNKCLLTINKFSETEIFVSGNRCEVGEAIYTHSKVKRDKDVINLYKYKYDRLFSYKSLDEKDAKRGKIGVPRVLNMYENYPFWHTFLTKLGFSVVLSGKSSKKIFEKGISSIASDTVCYPAKLVHGHIEDLIEKGIKTIFYPSVTHEFREDPNSDNHFNCPVVTSYPEVIKSNMDDIEDKDIKYINFFITLNDKEKLKKRIFTAMKYHYPDISKKEINEAVDAATEEYNSFKAEIRRKGEEAVELLEKENKRGIVLSGRPYHIDPEINHGIPELINSLGMAVLTEDSICHLANMKRPLRVVDQWVYHSRLYKAAAFCKEHDNLDMVQLNSFGCGLDAVTTEQVEEILNEKSKIHTVIKIDEGNNLGAAKIRLRSLKAAIKEREKSGIRPSQLEEKIVKYQKNTRLNPEHTLLAPQMAPMQFQFVEKAVRDSGLKAVVLNNNSSEIIEEGLRYVNNDACYPAIIVIGQIIHALKSGEYDPEHTTVLMSQTGGGCRATNYISFLRKALKSAGFENVPVVSISARGVEDNGLKEHVSIGLLNKLVMGVLYGDLLMKVLLRVRPYEKFKGSANALYKKWVEKCKESLSNGNMREFKQNINEIVKDFDTLEITDEKKPKVGLVGEILVKFSPIANNDLVSILEKEGAEAVVPELINFFLAAAYNSVYKKENLEGTFKSMVGGKAIVKIIEMYQKTYYTALRKSKRFEAPKRISDIAQFTKRFVSLGNQTGEGWLLPGEMLELLESGCNNIVCMQPFGCLPNHIIGKGVIKGIKKEYPKANIIPIDYDASATSVNQLNRIKLMLSTAFDEINNNQKEDNKFREIDLNSVSR